MNRHVWLAALIGVGAGIGLAACAGSKRNEAPASAYAPLDARKDDIRDLWMQIREWRVELNMPADPRPGDKALIAQGVTALRRCALADGEPGGTCGDVCNLKDAICDNADSICRIASDLGDAWADDKCKSAKSSCKEATDRCCACTGEAPDQTAPR
jgi:hypothetical protein